MTGRRTSWADERGDDRVTDDPPPRRRVTSWRALARAAALVVLAVGRPAAALAVGAQVAGALASTVLVVAAGLTVDALLAPEPTLRTLALPVLLLAAAAGLQSGASGWQAQQLRLIAEDTTALTWRHLLDVTSRADLTVVESPAFADRVGRIEDNALDQPAQVAGAVVTVVGAVTTLVAVGAALTSIAPALLPLLVLPAAPALLLARRAGRSEFRFYARHGELARRREYARELLSEEEYAKEVRSYDLAGPLLERHRQLSAAFRTVLRGQVRYRQRLAVASAALSAAALGVTLAVVAWLIVTDRLTTADAGAAVVAVRLVAAQLDRLLAASGTLLEAAPFLSDLEDFRDLAGPPPQHPAAVAGPEPLREALRLEGVHFRYPGSEIEALRGVDLHVAAGELVALVGENGSGKSTIVKIMAGLYAPAAGVVRWDDETIDDAASLRHRVTCLFQDFVEYELPLVDNVDLRAAQDPARRPHVAGALTAVGLDALVESLPDGQDTTLGHRFAGAVDLSGGQWQRLALARALARPAPLVILDEPSAALDPRAEQELLPHVRAALRGRAGVLVSHRYGWLRGVDRIYVLDRGRVVESGTHGELVAAGRLYAELFRLQA